MDAVATLEAVKAVGGVFGLTTDGRLSIDFGEAEVEADSEPALERDAAPQRGLVACALPRRGAAGRRWP